MRIWHRFAVFLHVWLIHGVDHPVASISREHYGSVSWSLPASADCVAPANAPVFEFLLLQIDVRPRVVSFGTRSGCL